MSKIIVAYWSQTGNTEAMANAVGEGIKAAGGEADVVPVSAVSVDELKAASSFALGCPAMGAEVLEESEMEPFVEEVEGFAAGKKIALFGSYGWGDGQWMRDWEERMNAAGATVVNGEGVIAHEAPDDEALEACRKETCRVKRRLAEITGGNTAWQSHTLKKNAFSSWIRQTPVM